MDNNTWILTAWGVRGSVPVASAEVMGYGGNTSCFGVEGEGELVIFDAGTGLIPLGERIAEQGGTRRVHILLSHLHIDHLMGLFGFRPLHQPGMEIHFYGESGEGGRLEERLGRLIGPPYWPLGLGDFPARLVFHETAAGDRFPLAGGCGLEVSTLGGNHPNRSLLYRLEAGEKSVTYALDCELEDSLFAPLADFARHTGVLVWDANFAPGDLRPGWGHSTWEQGIALGRAAGAGMVLMTHYNWEYDDAFLREQERLATAADGAVRFAKERMEIRL